MNRYPDGIDKEGFYEKDAPAGIPSWIETFNIYSETAQREMDYVVCNNLDTLIWMANLAALEINITLSAIDNYESPDLVFFDIDTELPCSFDDVMDIALLLKEKLDETIIISNRQGNSFINSGSSWQENLTSLFQSSGIPGILEPSL